MSGGTNSPGAAPPLRPFGLILHRDGRFTHEGQAIRNAKLRALFERSVTYLVEEGKYVVRAGRFRGEVEVEEAAFFVRAVDLESGELSLSDGSHEPLVAETLAWSRLDEDVLLCRVKAPLREGGLPARFWQSAQAELLLAVAEDEGGFFFSLAGQRVALPALP